jgi:glutamate 5-kinase
MVSKEIVVIKFGTASITKADGTINEQIIEQIAQQVALLQPKYHVVLVSSGAVGAGKGLLHNYKGSLIERKAAAAIGNPLLLAVYGKYFSQYNIHLAQSLCERQHFANRDQFLQLKQTYEELWRNGIIPIANENDVVSSRELKFSDNDELATLIATGFGAKYLLFSTSVGGLLDQNGAIVPKVIDLNASILGLADKDKSSLGLGGMVSKLNFTKKALAMGINVVIFGIDTPNGIIKAISQQTGTVFLPKKAKLSAHKKWLGAAGLVSGTILVDDGAAKAILAGKSLLAVGVVAVSGSFEANEIIQILNAKGLEIAVAKASVAATEVHKNLKTQNYLIAHADQIVSLA